MKKDILEKKEIKMQEIKNPRLTEIKKVQTSYKALKNDKDRLDFIAKHLNLE